MHYRKPLSATLLVTAFTLAFTAVAGSALGATVALPQTPVSGLGDVKLEAAGLNVSAGGSGVTVETPSQTPAPPSGGSAGTGSGSPSATPTSTAAPAASASPGGDSGGGSGGGRSVGKPASPVAKDPSGSGARTDGNSRSNRSAASGGSRSPSPGESASAGSGVARDRGDVPPQRGAVEQLVPWVPTELKVGLLAALLTILLLLGFGLRKTTEVKAAKIDSLIDPLTQIPNRRAFEQRLQAEWDRSERYGRPLSVVVVDVDGLKQINDKLGHSAGDDVIRRVGLLLTTRTRSVDMVARIGGDEFAVICPETPITGATVVTLSLRDLLHGLDFDLSMGVAEREVTDDSPDDLVVRADAAMYEDKRQAHEVAPLLVAA